MFPWLYGFKEFLGTLWGRIGLGLMMITITAGDVFAQAEPTDPEISVEMPFDAAPVITAVLAIAVTVLILIAGPKLSIMAGKTVLRKIGGILK